MSLESIIRKVLSAEVQETTITNEDLAPGVECDCQCGKVPCVECGKDHHKHEKEGISEDTLDEHFDDLDESAFRPPHMTKKDVDIQKAKKLMDPAKNRGDGINRIMKGMKLDKAKATKLHDLVMKKDMGEEVQIQEAEYQGKKVKLNDPIRGGSKKFYVYTKNEKGNVVKVSFGDTTGLSIKRDDPARRKSFRARHNCDDPGPKWKARYWSCYQWRANAKVNEEMDPTDHVKKKGDKFCVYNADGSIAKEFDNKEDADKYAIANHDKMMATAKEEVQIQEGVWHYPDAKQIAKFKKALTKKFIVGKEGYPAKDIIPFGDDELYDMLDDASDNNPKQDARPIFTRWINGRIRDNYAGYGKKTLAIAKQLGIREGVEQMSDENLNENSDAKRFGLSQSLVDAVASIIGGKQPTNAPTKKEDASNNKSDDGEGLDKADPKAAKKKFKDRKDKDIDNDGDTDDSDKFLHKKRKAIGKSMDKEEPKADAKSDKEDDADTKADPKKKKGKQEPVDTKPTMNAESVQKEEMSDEQMKKREEIMKELKKKEGYFKEKYGEKWEEVMYATATKMATK